MTRVDAAFIRRNLRSSTTRYRLVLVLMAVAAAALLLLSAVVGQGAAVLSEQLSHQSAVSSLKVTSASTSGTAVQLDAANLEKLATKKHVRSVDPWAQEGVMAQDSVLWAGPNTPLVFWATPRIAYAQPKIVDPKGGAAPALTGTQVIFPDQVGTKRFKGLVGKTFTFTYTVATGVDSGVDQEMKLTIAALYDNSVPGDDGQSAVYVSQSLESRLIAARNGLAHASTPGPGYVYPSAYVDVDDVSNVRRVQAKLAGQNYNVSSIASQVTQLPGLLRILSYLNVFIAITLLIFCLGSGIAIGSAWLSQRGREIGLLRALGWTRQRVFRSLVLEISAAGFICSIAGVIIGVITSTIASQLIAGRTVYGIEFATDLALPQWYWFVGVLIGLPIALALGAIRPVARLSRVAPDDALRQL